MLRVHGRSIVAIAALTLGVVALPARSYANCASDDPSGALRAAARMDVVTNCNCAGAVNHGAYVKCSAGRLKNNNPSLPKSCRGKVQKCAAKSTCGKPGTIICCKKNAAGKATCAAKKDCSHCVAPNGGSMCCSQNTSCCCKDATPSCSGTGNLCACASPSGAFLDASGF